MQQIIIIILKEGQRMAEIERVKGAINITSDITEYDFSKILRKMCMETENMVYVGERVNKQRSKLSFAEHEGNFYYVNGFSMSSGRLKVQLKKFEENFEETEPISNYKYCLEHHDSGADPDICIYYKEGELKQAKEAQKLMGEDLVRLYEI